jgi:hypothetical protein
MSVSIRTQTERPQSPTWEEIETLLARELKMTCGTRPRRRRRSVAKVLRELENRIRKCREELRRE